MKKYFLKPFIYFIIFIFTLIALLPKENIYFYLEKELRENNLILTDEKVKANFLGLTIKNAKIYYNETYFGFVKDITLQIFIFKNTINVDELDISNSFKNFLPSSIKKVSLEYSILNPSVIDIKAKSIMGNIIGYYSIFENKIYLSLETTSALKNKYNLLLNQFKLENGKYIYEHKL